ncbi:ParM/StbA family protein [Alicyclobacillus acidiphilus]|uniref:ParM/StbA family protein n=1 Tax=Alicyclobacillus acidiphilus TaxID=182455 RepID=UPI0008373285|nr:ParM/StbA family protein [Alicyclobacillus acidiphilus]
MGNSAYTVVCDSGKYFTKAISYKDAGFVRQKFRTLVQDGSSFSGVEVSGDSYRITFEGKDYIVGSMCSELAADFSVTKHTFEHRLSVYLSVALMLDKLHVERVGIPMVNLGINVPLNVYRNADLKERYRDYILNGSKPISLRVNGVAWVFRINPDGLLLFPEAIGSVYADLDKFRDARVTVIDIGSLNASFCVFERLIPKLQSMVLCDLGVNLLRGRVQEVLQTHFGSSVSVDESENVLHEGVYFLDGAVMPESKPIISDLKRSHVKEIVNFARSHGLSLNTPVFSGGGAILLKSEILEQFPSAVVDENGIYANAVSYWRLMEARGLAHV